MCFDHMCLLVFSPRHLGEILIKIENIQKNLILILNGIKR